MVKMFRYMAWPERSEFIGMCLDLDLITNEETLEEVKTVVDSLVETYVDYVQERGWENEMIPRRSPLNYWIRYYLIKCRMLPGCVWENCG